MKLMKLKILCVESDVETRDIISSFLKLKVEGVITSDNSEDAINTFKNEEPDIVILDSSFDNSNGIALAQKIKEVDPLAHIILFSSFTDPKHLLEAIDIGIDKYLLKPLDLEKLENAIDKVANIISQGQKLENQSKILSEYKLAVDESTIVSKTNPKGIITFVNDEFCNISGYNREELIGSNHNIVRHPDTPKEAFEDMWATIKAKETWKGTIKNKKKDGNPYYVKATVVPIINEKDEIEEFLAIRQDVTQLIELNQRLEDRVQEELDKNTKKDKEIIDSLISFLDASPNPVVVFDEEVVKFSNNNFLKLINKEKDEFCESSFNLESIFEDREGFLIHLEDLHSNYRNNKVSIKLEQGRRIFYIIESEILAANGHKLKMYTFNDITVNEYQKLKIQHYSGRLEDFIKKVQSKNRVVASNIETKQPEISEPSADLQIEKEEIVKEKRELSKDEFEVLKASRDGKEISAAEYASTEVDSYVLEEIQELDEIENEINEEIEVYADAKEVKELHSISERFIKYSSVINNLFEFRDLSFAITSLAELLGTIQENQLDETKQRKVAMFLTNLLLDLSGWRKTIFVDQTARDIHYLDSSLFSAILQLELVINENQEVAEDDDDDLELF